jgi:hypothetical protein
VAGSLTCTIPRTCTPKHGASTARCFPAPVSGPRTATSTARTSTCARMPASRSADSVRCQTARTATWSTGCRGTASGSRTHRRAGHDQCPAHGPGRRRSRRAAPHTPQPGNRRTGLKQNDADGHPQRLHTAPADPPSRTTIASAPSRPFSQLTPISNTAACPPTDDLGAIHIGRPQSVDDR